MLYSTPAVGQEKDVLLAQISRCRSVGRSSGESAQVGRCPFVSSGLDHSNCTRCWCFVVQVRGLTIAPSPGVDVGVACDCGRSFVTYVSSWWVFLCPSFTTFCCLVLWSRRGANLNVRRACEGLRHLTGAPPPPQRSSLNTLHGRTLYQCLHPRSPSCGGR